MYRLLLTVVDDSQYSIGQDDPRVVTQVELDKVPSVQLASNRLIDLVDLYAVAVSLVRSKRQPFES